MEVGHRSKAQLVLAEGSEPHSESLLAAIRFHSATERRPLPSVPAGESPP